MIRKRKRIALACDIAVIGGGLSLDRHVPLREADVSEIRRRLSEEHAVLSMPETK